MEQFPIQAPPELIALCTGWHSGQTSAMYSVLSTGHIHDADTLISLSIELSIDARNTKNTEQYPLLCRWAEWCDKIIEALSQYEDFDKFGNAIP